MSIPELYSRRRRAELATDLDVYEYEYILQPFRIQVWHIITDALGEDLYGYHSVDLIHNTVERIIIREYGLLELGSSRDSKVSAIQKFFLTDTNIDRVLDLIEVYFRFIITTVASYEYKQRTDSRLLDASEAVMDLNKRFKDNGLGYQFESGNLIRVDSEFIHSNAVKPVIAILRDARFSGANEEFLSAHEHYREARNEECLVDCCKAFESTMKTICSIRGWDFKQTDNAKTLINTCFTKGLLPSYLESEMTSLRTLFESGIPTIRNREAGHGQGITNRTVPDLLARYMLNQTASTILFLVESAEASTTG